MVPFVASPNSGAGWPDSHVTAQGMDCWVEWKDEGKHPEPIQLYRMRQIRKAGGCAFWTRDPWEAVKAIRLWVADGIMPPFEVRRPRG